jgi:NADPH:quinone reductase-like Zn-dependent oxidoreductase
MKAVRLERFGGLEVLEVVDVERPVPGPGTVLVEVRAAGINPGEAAIRRGVLAERYPSVFPHGQGSDLAGVVVEVGDGVTGVAPGDEVIGWVDDRSSHAELAVVPAAHLVPRPAEVPWEVAGGLLVAGATAWAGVRAVAPRPGETVVVAGAAGGVGSVAVQLARRAGATVVGLAGPANHAWLQAHGVVPVAYGGTVAEVADRVRAAAPEGVDAFVDTFGADYVDVALALGVRPERVNTIMNWAAVAEHGVKGEGSDAGASAEVLGELAGLVAKGELEVPVRTYPLADVRAAFADLERRHTRGKIVLVP